jgi:hypothetical protein
MFISFVEQVNDVTMRERTFSAPERAAEGHTENKRLRLTCPFMTNLVMGSRQPFAGLLHKAKRSQRRRDGQNPATGHAGRFAGPK